MGRVHVAITREVKPGLEEEFDVALREFAKESLGVPGTTGILLIRPLPGSGSREFGILRSFENEAARDQFYQSEVFQRWEDYANSMTVGSSRIRPLHGLEAFFRDGHRTPPPRWKMAIVTWLGVFPSILFWTSVLPPLLQGWYPLAAIAFTTVCMVITLAWLVMPLLTKLFAPWLNRPAQ